MSRDLSRDSSRDFWPEIAIFAKIVLKASASQNIVYREIAILGNCIRESRRSVARFLARFITRFVARFLARNRDFLKIVLKSGVVRIM